MTGHMAGVTCCYGDKQYRCALPWSRVTMVTYHEILAFCLPVPVLLSSAAAPAVLRVALALAAGALGLPAVCAVGRGVLHVVGWHLVVEVTARARVGAPAQVLYKSTTQTTINI